MIDLITHQEAAALAPIFGAAGLAGQVTGPMFHRREAMLTVQLGTATSYAACYALIGQETATAVCLTGAIQTTLALLAGNRPWVARMGYVFLPVVLSLGVLTYSGLPTLLAVTACCLIMAGRLQTDTLRMRGVQLGAAPFGMAHDALVGAWPCLAGALVSFTVAATAFRRERRRRNAAFQFA